jgi:hypothetical protein
LADPSIEYFGHPLFYQIVDELKALHSEKNRQYADKDHPLANFQRTGSMIAKFLKPGIPPSLAILLCYVVKHIDAVYDMVAEGKTNTVESLEDKCKDIAVYFILAMIILRESRISPDASGTPPR